MKLKLLKDLKLKLDIWKEDNLYNLVNAIIINLNLTYEYQI